jgi:hypothetical protein
MPGGKDAERLGASEASEPAGGVAPQEAVVDVYGEGILSTGEIQFLLISISGHRE